MLFNFLLGKKISVNKSKPLLVTGIIANLLVLCVFKYINFLMGSASFIFGFSYTSLSILLPLAISFFTFQQIAFIVDCFKGKATKASILEYSLFVTFFPQLIAGPIVQHYELVPQLQKNNSLTLRWQNVAVGISIFIVGLAKKAILADSLAPYADRFFSTSYSGDYRFLDSWLGMLTYASQLYFDFSGYADMAIGLGRIFGIVLPLNFKSPYKSLSIVDFWRRWHITLSTFLRDYLYIPLGGNAKGKLIRYVNLMITMLLGGLWHGADWSFVIWGGVHGLFLVINHLWRSVRVNFVSQETWSKSRLVCFSSWLLTFCSVCFAWVFFRAESSSQALKVINGLVGLNGLELPAQLASISLFESLGASFSSFSGRVGSFEIRGTGILLISIFIALACPSTSQIFKEYLGNSQVVGNKEIRKIYHWRAGTVQLITLAVMLVVSVFFVNSISSFIYFNF